MSKTEAKKTDKRIATLSHEVAQAWAAAPNSARWAALEAELKAAWEARWA